MRTGRFDSRSGNGRRGRSPSRNVSRFAGVIAAAYEEAVPGFDEQEDVIAASFIWRMQPETAAESGG